MLQNVKLILIIGLVALVGCSKSNFDVGDPIEPGMMVRISGTTAKRIMYSIEQLNINDSGHNATTSLQTNEGEFRKN